MGIFDQFALAVPCPKCRMNKSHRCRNMNRKMMEYVTEDGTKRVKYTALANGAVHAERMRYWERMQDELKRREKDEGVTAKQKRELEELREALKAAQEAEGIRLAV